MKKIMFLSITLILCLFLVSPTFAAMNQLKVVKTAPDGTPLVGLFPATYTDAVVLAANTPVVYSVPAGGVYALINCTTDVWVKFGAAAAIPIANITDGSAPSLNPALRALAGTTSIGFVSPAACVCSINIWNKQEAT